MSNNDYFTIAYKILSYLKYCYENGQDADPNILKADTFDISQQQFICTLQMLSDDGYIKGLTFSPVLDGGILLGNRRSTVITSDGLQYLAENSMMQKAYRIFKEVRDWFPLIK
ncbi:head protein [Lactobacillus bombicola]|uniref:Head protein n=1 Tax=Lactobacillus bombicola TaxID=1505723 RepID=A0ABX9LVH3_9LACO|nr:YjcQ family protein [Lactobacillus bombicola]RHW52873.1 head protein [Lactobacillus bombicola]